MVEDGDKPACPPTHTHTHTHTHDPVRSHAIMRKKSELKVSITFVNVLYVRSVYEADVQCS